MEMVSGKNQLPVSKIKTLMSLQHLGLKRKGEKGIFLKKKSAFLEDVKGFILLSAVNLEQYHLYP